MAGLDPVIRAFQAQSWRRENGRWIEFILSSRIRSCHRFPLGEAVMV
jgi:hypothetical protein